MSRKFNIGFAALLAMVALAAAFAVTRHASLPDAHSCIGKAVDNLRQNGLGAKIRPRDCHPRLQ